jgi:uncharacterized protein
VEQRDYELLLWDLPSDCIGDLLASGINVNAPDPSGNFLLTVAADRLNVDLVHALLAAGADPNVRNADGDTPILRAVDCVSHSPDKAYEIVTALVEAGADLELRGYMEKTPFLKACCRNDLPMIELLVRLGADYRATVYDGELLTGSDFADIFHAPKEVRNFLARLR